MKHSDSRPAGSPRRLASFSTHQPAAAAGEGTTTETNDPWKPPLQKHGQSSRSRRGPVDPKLLERARATREYLAVGVAIGAASAVALVAQAYLLATALAGTFSERDLTAATECLPWLAATFAVRALLSWANSVIAQRTAAAVKSQLRLEVMRARLHRRGPASLDGAGLASVLTVGLDALDGYFARYLPQLLLAATVPLILTGAVLSADRTSAVVLLLTLPLVPVFMVLVGWATQAKTRQRAAVQERLANGFEDLLTGLPTLQAFGRVDEYIKRLSATEAAHCRETLATLKVSFLSALVMELLATLSVAVIAVEIGLRVLAGNVSLSAALFVLLLAPDVYRPIRQVGTHFHDSADGVAAAERAFELIDVDSVNSGCRPVPDLTGSTVEIDRVSVSYGPVGPPALHRVSLQVAPDEVVAVTGPSGAGKSTLLQLLLGFVTPDEGCVRVDGVPLGELDLEAWLRVLAWVPQRPALIAGDVAANVRLGAPHASIGQVRSALAHAGAPDLDPACRIVAGGEGLSVGEARRVALARALLRVDVGGGRLLVLDEPTAALDAQAELIAIESVRSAKATALVVSHRPTVLAAADRVVVLEAPPSTTEARHRPVSAQGTTASQAQIRDEPALAND